MTTSRQKSHRRKTRSHTPRRYTPRSHTPQRFESMSGPQQQQSQSGPGMGNALGVGLGLGFGEAAGESLFDDFFGGGRSVSRKARRHTNKKSRKTGGALGVLGVTRRQLSRRLSKAKRRHLSKLVRKLS